MRRVLSILLTIIISFPMMSQSNRELNQQANKYGQALYYIQNFYLDTVNMSKAVDAALVATLKQLDPHSSYISKEDVEAMNEPLEAEFEGIGVEFAIINDTLTVQAPVSGGPSEKVGIRAGDKIVLVDGENIAGVQLTNEKVYKFLRGKKGTKVQLGISRRGVAEILDFTVVRDKIPLHSVDAVYEPAKGVLYIKLSRFAASSHDEILAAFEAHADTKSIIMDLRGNSGGYLHIAIAIANEFLSKDQLIVYTEGRTMRGVSELADGKGVFRDGALVVLVDENSASASEIVSGAIQDQDRGIIIGRRTFGKGLVQQMLPLGDGSQLRRTVARYHTPSGRVIQAPYEEGQREKYYQQFNQRFMHGESFSRDSIQLPDSLKFMTLMTGRVVYGGGGIMPDIFVPQDTSFYTPYYGLLLRNGVVQEYTNKVVDMNRDKWMIMYRSADQFIKAFEVDDALFDGLVAAAKEFGIEPIEEEIKISRATLENYIKALITSSLYERGDFYRVLHQGGDNEMERALDVIMNWNKYSKELNLYNYEN
ncbi:MAG: S41 family peptidase [Bacteroidales bacterium]|nr:S41 family peptidase [Bacteroidales bacterium]